MSPRTGRPTSDPKKNGYRVNFTDNELEKLNYCAKVLRLTKADIIRQGVDKMYEKAKNETKK